MTATATTPIEVTADLLGTWATDAAGPVALHLDRNSCPSQPTRASRASSTRRPTPTSATVSTAVRRKRVALIDSVGSQANRMEPIFKQKFSEDGTTDKAEWLVPQIEIVLSLESRGTGQEGGDKRPREPATDAEEKRSLLDLAHRSADAVVQSCPTLKKMFDPAFEALRRGDGTALRSGPDIPGLRRVGFARRVRRETSSSRAVHHPRVGCGRAPRGRPVQLGVEGPEDEQQDALKKEAKAKKVKLSRRGSRMPRPSSPRKRNCIPKVHEGAAQPGSPRAWGRSGS